MSHFKTCCILLCISFTGLSLFSQDKLSVKFGKVTPGDFDIKSTLIDSNTNAVIVADVGKSEFVANTSELTFSVIFTEKRRIKIINKNGFDVANITIPIYIGNNGMEEKLESLKAYTYNLENGNVVETKVDKSDIFTEEHNKHWKYKKFTFPNLKEGCIIEYSYQIKSDFFFEFHSWEFQDRYPVLWSQYEAEIPEFFKYVMISQGYQPYFINKTQTSQVNFTFSEHIDMQFGQSGGRSTFTVPGSADYHTWVMKNVPGLKPEPYTTTIQNSIAKIEFQLNQIKYPNSFPKNFMDTWEKVGKDLLEDENFGVPIGKANNWLYDDVEEITKGALTENEKSKKIFEYVRDHFTCDGKNKMFITSGLKDIVKNKSGSVADINMLLIAMLRCVKINADPVILSTRSHGYTHQLYPLMDRYNYVIAQVVIDTATIYLDATEPRISYGRLPIEVYNGHARLIRNGSARPVYFMADSLVEKSTTDVFISNMESGSVEGSYTHQSGVNESLELRNKIAKTTLAEYQKTLKESFPDNIEIENFTIDSLKLYDMPISEKYDIKLNDFNVADIIYFNPVLSEVLKKNPFSAAERYYPVEMPYLTNKTYTLNMEVPKGYIVDEMPKSTRVILNENDGMFEYLISNDGTYIQMKCSLIMRKANFANEEYQSLRDFYAFIVKKEAEQIVFKKIK